MNRNKKWMVTLDDDQYAWLKKLADEARVKGSAIVSQLIARSMSGEDQELKESLIEAQRKVRLQELQEKKREIEAELQKLGGQRTADRV